MENKERELNQGQVFSFLFLVLRLNIDKFRVYLKKFMSYRKNPDSWILILPSTILLFSQDV